MTSSRDWETLMPSRMRDMPEPSGLSPARRSWALMAAALAAAVFSFLMGTT
jgi:hypothetical protein